MLFQPGSASKPRGATVSSTGIVSMTARLVALDEGPDIVLDRAMVVVAAIRPVMPGSTRSVCPAIIAV